MRKIPDSLTNLQQKQREQTVSIVKAAVQELQAEGYPITVKRLCERTGLSRSLFSKPHVKAMLDEVKLSNLSIKTIAEETVGSQYAKLLLQLEKSKRRESELKSVNIQLRENAQELRTECELLRGKVHSLMRQNMMLLQERSERK